MITSKKRQFIPENLACSADVLLWSANYHYDLAIVHRAAIFDLGWVVEIYFSPQPSSASKIQADDQTFREELKY